MSRAGMRLPAPLVVRVLDRFGNPVPDLPVVFHVRKGGGRLGAGSDREVVNTGSDGRATAALVVSSEAGPNVVSAAVEGVSAGVEFTAYGTEA